MRNYGQILEILRIDKKLIDKFSRICDEMSKDQKYLDRYLK